MPQGLRVCECGTVFVNMRPNRFEMDARNNAFVYLLCMRVNVPQLAS